MFVDLHILNAGSYKPIPTVALIFWLREGSLIQVAETIRQSYSSDQWLQPWHHKLHHLSGLDFHCPGIISFSVCPLIYFIASLLVDRSHAFHCLHTHSSYPSITAPKTPPRCLHHTGFQEHKCDIQIVKMCYLVVERYSVCRCLYYQHSVDMCPSYGMQGHGAQEKTVLVGYACEKHSTHQPYQDSSAREDYSDSGYHTASHSSNTHSSRRYHRWNILSSITECSRQSRRLVRFEFGDWIKYLFSFFHRTS